MTQEHWPNTYVPSRPRPGRAATILAAMAAASFMAPLNSSMLAVALPNIRASFGVGVGAATWLVSGYLVSVAVAQPVGGRLGDAFGCRRVILWGLIILLGSSLAAAAATSYPFLLVTRALQGVSAALVMPTAVAYLRRATDPQRLGGALGANGAAISLGAALGPVVGAAVLIVGSWRWLFLMNVPLAVVALALVSCVPADRGRGRQALQVDGVSLIALAGIFLGMAVLGSARRLDDRWLLAGSVALLPAAAAGYLIRYCARGTGVVDLRLFTRRAYAASATTVALSNLVMYTALVAIPLYLADARGMGDAAIGVLLFAMSVAVVGVSPFAGKRSDRSGARVMIIAGSAVLLAGAACLAAILHHPAVILLAVPLLLIGGGLGLCQAAQQAAALKAWPGEMAGSAAGTLSMMRYVGSVTGTALIAALLTRHPSENEFRLLFLIVTAFAALGLAASLAMPRATRPGRHPRKVAKELDPEPAAGG